MIQKQPSPMPIRLPADMKAWIKARADANFRSVNAEIVAIFSRERDAEKVSG